LFVGLVVIDIVLDRENHGLILATVIGNRLIPEPTPNQLLAGLVSRILVVKTQKTELLEVTRN
jgi:hypothetical protein